MATITLFGLDIGKHSFHLVGQDANGKPVFKRQFTRSSLIHYLAQHPACRIVMEACCGAHWLGPCQHALTIVLRLNQGGRDYE